VVAGGATLDPLESPDGDGPPSRLVVRGFVLMGDIIIRS
jgi:hypothetical protein